MSMGELPAGSFEVTEDDLAAAQPKVRALLVQRYEELYARVNVRIAADADDGGRPLDPRFLELGVRILKEIGSLYRLGRQVVLEAEDEDEVASGVDRRNLVLAQLTQLEEKLTGKAA